MNLGPVWSDPEREYHFRKSEVTRRRRRWAAGAVRLLGMFLGLSALEMGARFAFPAPGGYSPVQGTDAREPMNSAGYRDVEHTREKPPGVRRVVFIGNSSTSGAGILFDDTYARRTERGLSAARSEKWESIVLAAEDVDIEREEESLQAEGLDYSPDLVVLGYALNDAEAPGAAERGQALKEAGTGKEGPERPFWRRSFLLNLIAEWLRAPRERRGRVQTLLDLHQEGGPRFSTIKKSIEQMAARCRDRGVPFLVVLFPPFGNSLGDDYPFASVHARVAAVARSAGAEVVDLFPYYHGMDWRLLVVDGASDEHPNELAHRIAAQALLASLSSIPLPERVAEPAARTHQTIRQP